MQFGTEILRGVRLAAILIAIGLVSLTVYRMLDLVDDDDTASAASSSVAAPAQAKPAVKQSKGAQFYPPPPPPLPGRAVAAKPASQGRDIVVVNVPEAHETLVADASPVPSDLPSASAVAVKEPVVAEPQAAVPVPAEPTQRPNRFVRSMRRLLHMGK
jgi:hypothetical protein